MIGLLVVVRILRFEPQFRISYCLEEFSRFAESYPERLSRIGFHMR